MGVLGLINAAMRDITAVSLKIEIRRWKVISGALL